jgi:hypothetical protein
MRVPVRMARPSLVSGESVSPGKEVAVLAGENVMERRVVASGSLDGMAVGVG